MTHDPATLDLAIAWHVRLSSDRATGTDWEAFSAWMEADPANGDAYDEVALSDDLLTQAIEGQPVPPQILPSNDNEPLSWFRRRGMLTAAASVALVLAVSPLVFGGRTLSPVETRPGEVKELALGDGTQAILNGNTRIEIDRDDPRFVRLASGEAMFTVKHDPSDPFTVEVGDHEIVDVGTEFNVRQESDSVEVAVSQGAVQLNPRSDALRVNAGQQVAVSRGETKPVVTQTDPATVGGWRKGQFAYRDATMERIAADLSRLLGQPVSVDQSVRARRFSGLIRLEGDRAQAMNKVGPLLGIKVRRVGNGWAFGE